ncbi:hypothetical protein DSM104299_03852 [Baekduia alba]|nr:Dyp-type peroxidase domain-containing protein [Baekduia alba]WCB95110.1 hypothetical protein DSM104299_03852 [Baekduia alba]
MAAAAGIDPLIDETGDPPGQVEHGPSSYTTMSPVSKAVAVVDEVSGFRYFDSRDLLGFVHGTANPTGAELPGASFIAEGDDPDFAGGSYVVVQKYVHDLAAWGALDAATQEAIIGRTKADNIELDGAAAAGVRGCVSTGGP